MFKDVSNIDFFSAQELILKTEPSVQKYKYFDIDLVELTSQGPKEIGSPWWTWKYMLNCVLFDCAVFHRAQVPQVLELFQSHVRKINNTVF